MTTAAAGTATLRRISPLMLPMMVALAPQGLAQDSSTPRITSSLEEIVVTARKKTENLQVVPQSVSALSKSEIENSFSRDVRDLEGMSPNLVIDHISAAPGTAAISLRGVSFQDLEKSFDPTVGMVVDGIFLGTNSGHEMQVFDLERVEVLRGPQGTLFGKNAIGGVINVTRTNPTGEWGAKIRARAGNYERREIEGVFNMPVVRDQLAAKFTVTHREQKEGYYNNTARGGEDTPEMKYDAFSINLLATPHDDLTLEYVYQREDDDTQAGPLLNFSQPASASYVGDSLCTGMFGRCARDADTPESGDMYTVANNFGGQQFLDLYAHTFEANWTVSDEFKLTYLLGIRKSDEATFTDYDATELQYFETGREQKYLQRSNELRASGRINDSISYVAGVYFWHSEYQMDMTTTIFVEQFGIPFPSTSLVNHKSDSSAVFTEWDFAVTDRSTIVLGGRYTREKKELGIDNVSTGLLTLNDPTEEDWTEFSPRISYRFQLSEDQMFYATYSNGFRSGGMNGRANTLTSARQTFDPEIVDNYEIGYKSEWLDRRLQLNVAIFSQQYKDKQEEVIIQTGHALVPQETVTFNVAEATINGLELDIKALPVDGWSIGFNFGYLDAEYDDFYANLRGTDPATGLEYPATDNSGLILRRAPEFTFALSSLYEVPIGAGIGSLQLSYRYKDDFETDFRNFEAGHVDAHGLFDASINYEIDSWRFSIFGRNLTDEDQVSAVVNVYGIITFGAVRDPRTWGGEVTYTFE